MDLVAVARDLNLEALGSLTTGKLGIGAPCSPIQLIIEPRGTEAFVYLSCFGRPFDGECSDVREIYSIFAAIWFASRGIASCALRDVPHPADLIPGELYGRYLLLAQPHGGWYALDDDCLDICELIQCLASMERAFHEIFQVSHMDELINERVIYPGDCTDVNCVASGDSEIEEIDKWVAMVDKMLSSKLRRHAWSFVQRVDPGWYWARHGKGKLTAAASTSLVLSEVTSNATSIRTDDGTLVRCGRLRLYLSDRDARRSTRLLTKLLGRTPDEVRHYPLENMVVSASGGFALFRDADCGSHRYAAEARKVSQRYREVTDFLEPATIFQWADSIPGELFERLTYDLVVREPGVSRVRAWGSTNEADHGRDLLIELTSPIQAGEAPSSEATPLKTRRLVGQCKSLNRAVGLRDIIGFREAVEWDDADGYWLFSARTISVSALDQLATFRRKGMYIDYWTRTEIEERLRKHTDVLERYASIVSAVRD